MTAPMSEERLAEIRAMRWTETSRHWVREFRDDDEKFLWEHGAAHYNARVELVAEVDRLRALVARPAEPSCTAEHGGPGYTTCTLPAGHDGHHTGPLGTMRTARWTADGDRVEIAVEGDTRYAPGTMHGGRDGSNWVVVGRLTDGSPVLCDYTSTVDGRPDRGVELQTLRDVQTWPGLDDKPTEATA